MIGRQTSGSAVGSIGTAMHAPIVRSNEQIASPAALAIRHGDERVSEKLIDLSISQPVRGELLGVLGIELEGTDGWN